MADPVVVPEIQYCDANGVPYAGGTLTTYIPGTDTLKNTYLDPGLTSANTNPIILDAAGRSLMYGDGDYRLVLRDAAGNLIWDVQGTTIASAAMAPVVGAPTIADAQALLGISDSSGSITAETNRAIAAENTITNNLNNEIARAEAVENAIKAEIDSEAAYQQIGSNLFQWGQGNTGTPGVWITFPVPFDVLGSIQVTLMNNAINLTIRVTSPSTTQFNCSAEDTDNTGPQATNFFWFAVGQRVVH